MRIGKISDSVLKRSVLKLIKTKNNKVLQGAGVGEDCAFFSCDGQGISSTVTSLVIENAEDVERAIIKSTNNLATSKAEPMAVLLSFMLPQDFEEPDLKKFMMAAEKTAGSLKIQIAGGHTGVSSFVSKPVLTVTAYGSIQNGEFSKTGKIKPGMDIVVTKWIGLEGSFLLAEKYKEELLKRYPSHLVEEAINFKRYLSVIPEAAVAWMSGAASMHDVSEGGIFSALWEMAESAGVGLSIDLRKLPIRQETVEICERLERNPYELLGGGSLVIATMDGEALTQAMTEQGYNAVIVGKFTDSNDKLIYNDDEKRYMDRPAMDQVYDIESKGEAKS